MIDTLARVELAVLTGVFALVAGLGLLAPHVLFDTVHVVLEEPAALAEIRAAYFGLFGTAAFVYQLGFRRETWRRPALRLAALVLGGFTLGRLWSLAVDGLPSWVGWVNLSAEAIGLGLALFLLNALGSGPTEA